VIPQLQRREVAVVMRTLGIVVVAVCAAGASGCCGFLRYAAINLTETPLQAFSESRREHRNYRLAKKGWAEFAEEADHTYSHDFKDGFIDGYADYLDHGGNGDPPATPPFHYRSMKYQTPEGVEAINDWYAGWKQGASAAIASGQREVELVPLSKPPINEVPRYGPPIELPSLPPPRVAPPSDQ
jgi:hypothetical protein